MVSPGSVTVANSAAPFQADAPTREQLTPSAGNRPMSMCFFVEKRKSMPLFPVTVQVDARRTRCPRPHC